MRFRIQLVQEALRQLLDIAAAFTQRWYMDREHCQPVHQILPQTALLHGGLQ